MAQKIDLKPVLKAVDPEEAIAYFRQKSYQIGFDYRDVWQQEHQAGFTVAKAMQLDLLTEIRGFVDDALAKGGTLAEFQKELTPLLQKRGWWDKQEVLDPVTGDTVLAQLGSPRRLEVIFDTNLATAYSEGQWERIQRNKELFPFLEYVRSASTNPRHTHLAYSGLVLRADDAFWQSHLPIKEFNCKCSVIQHSQRMLDREGLTVGKAPPEKYYTTVNKRTGDVMTLPTGVHPAFNYPPGGRRANLGKHLMDRADQATARMAARVLHGGQDKWLPGVQLEFAEFVRMHAAGERQALGLRRVVGVFSPQVIDSLTEQGIDAERATIFTTAQKLNHLIGNKRGEARKLKGAGVDFVSSLPQVLQQVGEVWLVKGTSRLVMFATSDEPGKVVKVVADVNAKVRDQNVGNAVVSMELINPKSFDLRGHKRLDK